MELVQKDLETLQQMPWMAQVRRDLIQTVNLTRISVHSMIAREVVRTLLRPDPILATINQVYPLIVNVMNVLMWPHKETQVQVRIDRSQDRRFVHKEQSQQGQVLSEVLLRLLDLHHLLVVAALAVAAAEREEDKRISKSYEYASNEASFVNRLGRLYVEFIHSK
jgi:hypothetical protein